MWQILEMAGLVLGGAVLGWFLCYYWHGLDFRNRL